MKQVVDLINEKLRSIIEEITKNRDKSEKELNDIKEEMDKEVALANEYKEKVESSKETINTLEEEIDKLKNDLNDLEVKFGNGDFKDLLAAGNKEINGHIINRNARIQDESNKIKQLQAEALKLKQVLVDLKDKKTNLEDVVSNYNIALKYYDTRLGEVMLYASKNAENLDKFDEVKTEEKAPVASELIIDTKDYSNIDVDKIVDDKVFDEIDNIDNEVEPSQEDIEKALNDALNEEKIVNSKPLSETQLLDDAISKANEIINNEKKEAVAEEKEEKVEDKVEEEHNDDEINPSPEETIKVLENPSDEPIISKEVEEPFNIVENDDVININVPDEITTGVEEKHDDEIEEHDTEQKEEHDTEQEEVHDTKQEEVHDAEQVNTIVDTMSSDVKELGLEPDKFKAGALDKIKVAFNKENARNVIDVLKKHNIDIDNIYDKPSVLVSITSTDLNHILELLEQTGASHDTINYVFDDLDKINIHDLEGSAIETKSLITLLHDCVTDIDKNDISDALNLNYDQVMKLKESAGDDDYDTMCMFNDVVVANYNELKKYKVNNLNDCIVNHPHRFLYNPDIFKDILDKYDPEDLVRCIEKNCAVIDKL